jgi:putative PIN family toxin of toxin-antitoxin system
MIRVVLDTNIVVSALLRSGGLPEAVFNLAMKRSIQVYISEPILAEYEEVLRRPRLDIQPDKVTKALARIREAGVLVTPATPVSAASDPDDNIFWSAPKPLPFTFW